MCKFLIGDGATQYTCKFTKNRCGYQKYCPQQHKYVVNCDNCPIYKQKSTQKQ